MKVKLGTRGSALALKQTEIAQKAIKNTFDVEIEIIKIKTSGDKNKNCRLADYGGKGLFVKELEQALIENRIDIAVHSLKDLPGNINEINHNLIIVGFLEREDPRDVFISHNHKNLHSLPYCAKIGTCSPRRAIQLRPDLQIKLLRGNIETRLEKAKYFDGIILARAALKRLNMLQYITEIIPTEVMLPAVGQGVVCLQCNKNNQKMINIIDKVNHEGTKIVAQAERAFLSTINGNCHTPLAAFARIIGNKLHLRAMVEINGKPYFDEKIGDPSDATNIGRQAAEQLIPMIDS